MCSPDRLPKSRGPWGGRQTSDRLLDEALDRELREPSPGRSPACRPECDIIIVSPRGGTAGCQRSGCTVSTRRPDRSSGSVSSALRDTGVTSARLAGPIGSGTTRWIVDGRHSRVAGPRVWATRSPPRNGAEDRCGVSGSQRPPGDCAGRPECANDWPARLDRTGACDHRRYIYARLRGRRAVGSIEPAAYPSGHRPAFPRVPHRSGVRGG
jgi:hypothetical protein